MSSDLEVVAPATRHRGLTHGSRQVSASSPVSQNVEFLKAERALEHIARQARRMVMADTVALAKLLGATVFSTILTETPKSGGRLVLTATETDHLLADLHNWLRERLLVEKKAANEESGIISVSTAKTLEGEKRGSLLSIAQGRARLANAARALPTETWAGEVWKPSELVAELGIARSTLALWRERGDVLAFKAGKVKHVYPVEQFVNACPLPGLARLRTIVGADRALWLWLKTRSPQLSGEFPLDRLKQGDVTSVEVACKDIFGAI